MGNKKTKKSPLVIVLYILAALMAAVFVYMIASTVSYLNMTMQAYGMSIGDMWVEALQQVVVSSGNFLAYAVIIFGIAKVIDRIDAMKASKEIPEEEKTEAAEETEVEAPVEEAPAEEAPAEEAPAEAADENAEKEDEVKA